MSASQYENLIRAIFQCEEGRKHGATADIYYNLLDARNSAQKKEIALFREGVCIGELRAYLTNALFELKEKYADDKEVKTELDECSIILTTPDFESINECIDKAAMIIEELNLKAP